MAGVQSSLFGKTFPGPSAPTEERTSDASLKNSPESQAQTFQFLRLKSGKAPGNSWATLSLSHGASSMRNIGECPSAAVVSSLSQILTANAPEKYYLTPAASRGILRRAAERGKELPPTLKEALERAAHS